MNRWTRAVNIYLSLSCLLLLCGAVTGAYLSEPSQEESIKHEIRNASMLVVRAVHPALPGMSFAQGKGVDAILTSQGRPCTCKHTTTYHYHSSYHSSSGSSMPAWMVWPLLGVIVLIGIVSWIVKYRRGGDMDDDCEDYTWRRENHASSSLFTSSSDNSWPSSSSSSSDSGNTNEGGGFFGSDTSINWSDGDTSSSNGGGGSF